MRLIWFVLMMLFAVTAYAKTYEKGDDGALVETETIEKVTRYNYVDLIAKRDEAVKQQANYQAKADELQAEIDKWNALIAEADKQGVTEKTTSKTLEIK